MDENCIIKAEGINKSYGRKRVITDLDLKINKGDIYGFLGPNGAGKTTTIKILLGLVRYDCGSVEIMGYDIKKDFKKAIVKVGAVVETPRFYENFSAFDNLKMIKNLYPGVDERRIDEVLELVGLKRRAKEKVENYSLGMKQRLGIARALINEPELIILDEPTNGLDPQGMKEIRDMIVFLSKEKHITFFISTHLLNEVEHICNKVGIIKNGTKVIEGYVRDLLNKEFETIELYVDSIEKTQDILHKCTVVKSVKSIDNHLSVDIERGTSPILSKLLVEAGMELKYLVPKQQSLEEYFIEKTKGGEHIV